MRKNRGPDDVRVAVHRVQAPQDRNSRGAIALIHRSEVIRVGSSQPRGRRRKVIAARARVATIEHRPEPITMHILRRYAGDVRLDDLPHFVFERHRGEQLRDSLLERGVGAQWALDFGPKRRVRGARSSWSFCGGSLLRVRGIAGRTARAYEWEHRAQDHAGTPK